MIPMVEGDATTPLPLSTLRLLQIAQSNKSSFSSRMEADEDANGGDPPHVPPWFSWAVDREVRCNEPWERFLESNSPPVPPKMRKSHGSIQSNKIEQVTRSDCHRCACVCVPRPIT